jgi:hypothetical protein
MLYRYIVVLFFLGNGLLGGLSFIQPASAESLVELNAETRLLVALHMGQAELQKLVPSPWQVGPLPGGPLKQANFFIVFIDTFLAQDPQGKPLKGGMSRKVVFAIPAKNMQTSEIATIVIGGFEPNNDSIPGPYKNYALATVQKEQALKGTNMEAGIGEEFWQVRDNRGAIIEMRVQYQGALPLRAKSEQKLYSAEEPTFYRIYRQETAGDIIKSIPGGIDRIKSYRFHVAVPKLSNLFNGTEQLIGVVVYPLFLRQVFLP